MRFSKSLINKYSQAKSHLTPDDFIFDSKAITFIYKDGQLYTGPGTMVHGDLAKKKGIDYENDVAGRVSGTKQEVALWDISNQNPYDPRTAEALMSLYGRGIIDYNTRVYVHPSMQGVILGSYFRNYKKQEEKQESESFSAYSSKVKNNEI